MKKLSICLLVFLVYVSYSYSAVLVDVYASPAPNFNGPSWAGYINNYISWVTSNGSSGFGNRNTNPTAYTQGVLFTGGDMIISSSYNLWRGQTSPISPFDSELGGRIHFNAVVRGVGEKVSLWDITYTRTSTDTDTLFTTTGGYSGLNYSSSRIGVDLGTDGVFGGTGPDVDTFYLSGAGNIQVDVVFITGPSIALVANTEPDVVGAMNYIDANAGFTVETVFTAKTGVGSETISVVPEPSSVILLSIALTASLLNAKRKRFN